MTGPVLVLNAGSSSMKYQLIDVEAGATLGKGLVERIGEKSGAAKHTDDAGEQTWEGAIPIS